jgi:hypothetical protein
MKLLASIPGWVLILSCLGAFVAFYSVISSAKTVRDWVIATSILVLAVALFAVQFKATADSQVQAEKDHREQLNATLGSSHCPTVMMDFFSGQRPHGLSVFNPDKANGIYSLVLHVQEGEHTDDRHGWHTLQQRTLTFSDIPPGAGSVSQPFDLLSRGDTSYLQFDLSTHSGNICSGLIVAHVDSNGNWSVKTFPVHQGPITAHKSEIPEFDSH